MNENLSALMDGALEDGAAGAAIEAAGRNQQARDVWRTYHVIGDALRGEPAPDFDCCKGVMAALDSEPTVLAPVPRRAASNSRMRWALPLAASVVGVGAVGWVAQTVTTAPTLVVVQPAANGVQQVAAPAPTLVAVQPVAVNAPVVSQPINGQNAAPVVPVSGNFAREYLIAHQAQSPSANMAGVAQYVRTVSESRQEQAR